ncbi:MAG: FMN-binding protein [Desulfomonilaceae bacterium]
MSFIRNIAFIFVIAFLFAGLTSGVNMALSKRIQLNEQTRLSKQLLEVLGIPFSSELSPAGVQALESEYVKSIKFGPMDIYASFDDKGSVQRYAFPITGKGLWGSIQGLMSLDKDFSKIEGLIFTSHVETPGLGARIDEKWFRDQFRGLDLTRKASPERYVLVQSGARDSANRVDSITGATITSTAVETMLNRDIQRILTEKDKIRGIDWQFLPKR